MSIGAAEFIMLALLNVLVNPVLNVLLLWLLPVLVSRANETWGVVCCGPLLTGVWLELVVEVMPKLVPKALLVARFSRVEVLGEIEMDCGLEVFEGASREADDVLDVLRLIFPRALRPILGESIADVLVLELLLLLV